MQRKMRQTWAALSHEEQSGHGQLAAEMKEALEDDGEHSPLDRVDVTQWRKVLGTISPSSGKGVDQLTSADLWALPDAAQAEILGHLHSWGDAGI